MDFSSLCAIDGVLMSPKAAIEKLVEIKTEGSPFGTIHGYTVDTLKTYTTPYYFCVGPAPLGSVKHFPTIRRLTNYVNKLIAAGKLAPKVG